MEGIKQRVLQGTEARGLNFRPVTDILSIQTLPLLTTDITQWADPGACPESPIFRTFT